jgi:hypothetical protein
MLAVLAGEHVCFQGFVSSVVLEARVPLTAGTNLGPCQTAGLLGAGVRPTLEEKGLPEVFATVEST